MVIASEYLNCCHYRAPADVQPISSFIIRPFHVSIHKENFACRKGNEMFPALLLEKALPFLRAKGLRGRRGL